MGSTRNAVQAHLFCLRRLAVAAESARHELTAANQLEVLGSACHDSGTVLILSVAGLELDCAHGARHDRFRNCRSVSDEVAGSPVTSRRGVAQEGCRREEVFRCT